MKKLFRLPALTLVLAVVAIGQDYPIQTFAGGAPPRNVLGPTARLGICPHMVVDANGNVFLSLTDYSAVARIDSSGLLALVVGNGLAGAGGDNGPALSAELNRPQGLALDSAGNLYIADNANFRVRKVANGVITTVAGTGIYGSTGDNGSATGAQLAPLAVAVDSAGNLYVADYSHAKIRKVANGVITTVAGNGTTGFGGDNGPATSAELSGPSAIAVDQAGNLYIADSGNNRIRKVANGMITTVTGNGIAGYSGDNGPATAAMLNVPTDVATDAAGNVYIADFNSSHVRKVSNGMITTVAGGATLALNGPYGVAADSAGNVYIADRVSPSDNSNFRVLKLSNGALTTLAGNAAMNVAFTGDGGPPVEAQLAAPSGIAFDSAGDLYIAELGNRVRKISNGVITTVAGNGTPGFSGDGGPATSAQLYFAQAVAVDAAGNLYIADSGNYRVRKVSNGVITTVAGNGTAGYSGDNGPATKAQLNSPVGVAVDSAGNLYIADRNNHVVREVSNGVITRAVQTGFAPQAVAVDGAENLYVADSVGGIVSKVSNGVITTVAGNGTPGFSGDNGPAIRAQLNAPIGVTVDSAGNLYIAEFVYPTGSGNNRVRKVSKGMITTVAGNGRLGFSGDNGPATGAEFQGPEAVAVDSSGNVYIADTGNNRVRVVGPAACGFYVNPASLQIGAAGGSFPLSIQTGGASCPWTVSNLPDGITVTGATTGAGPATVTLVVGANTGAALQETISVAGVSVSVAQAGAYIIQTVAGNGTAGYSGDNGPAADAQLQLPSGVAVDNTGILYIADSGNQRIRVVSNGAVTTVAGNGTAGFSADGSPAANAELNDPSDIAVDAAGNLYVAEYNGNRIFQISGGVITTVAGDGTRGYSGDGGAATKAQVNGPLGVAVDSLGNLYFADSGNERIRMVANGVITTVAGTGTFGFSGDNGPAASAELNAPAGVAVDTAGNLYLADYGNQRIRMISNGVISTIAGTGTLGFSGDSGPATAARLNNPYGVAVDSTGNLYISERGGRRIRIVSNGVIMTVAGNGTDGSSGDGGPATSAQLSSPHFIAVDSSGNLYIADYGNNVIRELVSVPPPDVGASIVERSIKKPANGNKNSK